MITANDVAGTSATQYTDNAATMPSAEANFVQNDGFEAEDSDSDSNFHD
jgi:hypothetical protein